VPVSLYVRRDSFVHRLHTLTKAAFLLTIFAAALAVTHPLPTLGIGLFVATWAGLGRCARVFATACPMLIGLFVVTAVIWTWAYPGGGAPLHLGPLEVPSRGALFGLAMGTRMVVYLGAGLVFLATTRVEAFAAALERLGLPRTAGFVLTLAFRLVPIYVETALTVAQAQRARGYEMDRGPVWGRVRRRARLIVPIFLAGLRNADGMALALEARGFGRRVAGRGRGLSEERLGWRDALALTACAVLLAVVHWVRRQGWGAV
jgi:energy-coupling factor transport system permease protein